MKTLVKWFLRGTEFVAAMMMAAMFLTFILQIAIRYSAKLDWLAKAFPILDPSRYGWTLEFCLALWVWIVFWGAAFVVRERDHVTFDLLYLAMPRGPRRVMALVSCAVVAVALAWSLLPTWDWIDFLRIKKSATLKVPMRTIYSIYAVFLVAVSARFAWRFFEILRYGEPRDSHDVHVGEEG